MEIKNRIDPNDKDLITTLINKDPLKRKVHLENLIQLFNNISEPITVGIDGEWGTGKTIFLKQLEILINSSEDIDVNSSINLTEFKQKNRAFYFNSWENDLYNNPLQSLLFCLSTKYKEELNKEGYDLTRILKIGKTVANVTMKVVSNGALGVEDFEVEKGNPNRLIESIMTVEEIRSEIAHFLQLITKEKKLIIIVDELDRCKPTFAVELLEVIKHYFLTDNIQFILCSNKSELSHTVKKYYGPEFNGYEYLDRFMDFEYLLPAPDRRHYIKNILGVDDEVEFSFFSHMVVDHFELSLRQINKYVLHTELIIKVWNSEPSRDNSMAMAMFLFYFSGINLINKLDGKEFLNGNGFEKFKLFYTNNEIELKAFDQLSIGNLKNSYDSVFNGTMNYSITRFLNFLTNFK